MSSSEKEKQSKILNIARQALVASRKLREVTTEQKKGALYQIADLLDTKSDDIKFRNEIDIEAGKQDGLSQAMLDRLVLDDARIKSMTNGIREVADMVDPVSQILESSVRPSGIQIDKVSVPIGVIAMIYESRPNVTGDAAALCLMSSNSVILRGGREALNSNMAIEQYIREALADTAIPDTAVQLIDDSDRKLIEYLVSLKGLVDLVIPRGSEAMIEAVTKISAVPVIGHGKGLCHLYIDKTANKQKSIDIALNAKVQRPGVCNAIETLIIHSEAASELLPAICESLESAGVELRGDERACQIHHMAPVVEDDWSMEYLSLILSIKTVDSIEEAIAHIEKYGSHHSDAIITEDENSAKQFMRDVDSSCVYTNASTRFTDGAEMGLGAEIGISNQKLHARGPMGLRELTSYKYQITGTGQIRK